MNHKNVSILLEYRPERVEVVIGIQNVKYEPGDLVKVTIRMYNGCYCEQSIIENNFALRFYIIKLSFFVDIDYILGRLHFRSYTLIITLFNEKEMSYSVDDVSK